MYAMSWVELARDYYPEGFRLAEHRYDMPIEAGRNINTELLASPRWQGEDVAGKRFFVHGEQGLGDAVMMVRYLPLLLEHGAKVVMDVASPAISLFSHSFPECEFVKRTMGEAAPVTFDYWTAAMSFPYHFATMADTVPSTGGYLIVPPDEAAYWAERMETLARPDMLRVGVAWSGNPQHRFDRIRSIPFELFSRALAGVSGVQFFALQTTVPDNVPGNLTCCSDEMVTLADTAALINAMDLVITIDTSVVHLAGAVGKTTWLLLPHRYEWRWSMTGEKNNWYDSVRVLRQEAHGDWETLLAKTFGTLLPDFAEGLRREK